MFMTDIITILIASIYGLVALFIPDFPLTAETFSALILWILARFGYNSVKRKQSLGSYRAGK